MATLDQIVADRIYDIFISSDKKYICFFLVNEGLIARLLIESYRIINYISKTYLLPASTFRIKCFAAPIQRNIDYYKNHCDINAWIPVHTTFTNGWEEYGHELCLRNLHNFSSVPRIKSKLFLSFNGCYRHHRAFLIEGIIRPGLLDRALMSMYFSIYTVENLNKIQGAMEYYLSGIESFLPKNGASIKKNLLDKANMFPLSLGLLNSNDVKPINIDDSAVDYFNNSYFSVVTETKCLHDIGLGDTQLDCILFTEKIYKTIVAKHPFIMMAMPESLSALRQAGYKTFHPYIDETYDTIENDETRLVSILQEISRLSTFTDSQWLEWQENIKPILEHNRQVLLRYQYTQLVYDPAADQKA